MSQHGTNSHCGMMRPLKAAAEVQRALWHATKAAAHRSKRLQAGLEPASAVCVTPANYVRRAPMIAFMGTTPSVEYAK